MFKLKKILLFIISISILLYGNLALAAPGNPSGVLDDKLEQVFKAYSEETGLVPFSDTDSDFVIKERGYYNITTVIYALIGIMKYVAFGIMLLVAAVSIFRLITAGSEGAEEVFGHMKKYLIQILVAVGVILTSEFIFNKVLIPGSLDSVGSAKAAALKVGGELAGIVGMIQGLIVAFSIFMLVWAGAKMISNMGSEEALGDAKNQILWGIGGLVVVMLGGTLVNEILFVDAQSVDPLKAQRLIVSITNFLSGLVTTISLLAFFYAGAQYVFGGFTEVNQDRIKTAIFGGIVGIIIALGAFAIVNTVIDLDSNATRVFDQPTDF